MPFEVKECETHIIDSPTTTWIDFALPIPICIIFHIILFIHGLRHQKYLRKEKVKIIIPILFNILQSIALLTDINELFRLVIGGRWFPNWFQNPLYCYLSSVISRILVPIFYIILCNFLLYRLRISFKHSTFAFPSFLCKIMMTMSFMVGIVYIILTLTNTPPCLRRYYVNDIHQTLQFCRTNFEGDSFRTIYTYIAFMFIIVVNVFVGYSFIAKLRKVIKQSNGTLFKQSDRNHKIEKVMIKNTVLTISTSISTFIAYIMWLNVDGFNFFLYIDYAVNCLMVALMYSYNEKYYRYLCSPCTRCLLRCYGVNIEEKELFAAIKRDMSQLRTPTIASATATDGMEITRVPSTTNTVIKTPSTVQLDHMPSLPQLQLGDVTDYKPEDVVQEKPEQVITPPDAVDEIVYSDQYQQDTDQDDEIP